MSRTLLLPAVAALALLVAAGCSKKEEMDPELFEQAVITLRIKGKNQFSIDENRMQQAFNAQRKAFRAGNDDMSEYLLVQLDEVPFESGQEVTADVSWRKSSVQSKNGISFRVEKVDGDGYMWLWNAGERMALVIRKF